MNLVRIFVIFWLVVIVLVACGTQSENTATNQTSDTLVNERQELYKTFRREEKHGEGGQFLIQVNDQGSIVSESTTDYGYVDVWENVNDGTTRLNFLSKAVGTDNWPFLQMNVLVNTSNLEELIGESITTDRVRYKPRQDKDLDVQIGSGTVTIRNIIDEVMEGDYTVSLKNGMQLSGTFKANIVRPQ